jgi:voltage-gated potassium channel
VCATLAEIEHEPGRSRIAVSRLANRARVEEPTRLVEVDLEPFARETACDAGLALLPECERDVAVPDEDERRRRHTQAQPRNLCAQDVVPDRVARAAVEELRTVRLGARLESLEEGPCVVSEHALRPARRCCSIAREVRQAERAGDDEVVIAGQAQVGPCLDERAALVRPGPVADRVAETPDGVDALLVDPCERRHEGMQVRVDVRDDGDPHGADDTTAVIRGIRVRQAEVMVVAVVVVLVGGTLGFRWTLDETWLQAFYRSVVTTSLTGIDTVPNTDGARLITIVLVICGITLFGYIAAVIVEAIAGGVVTGALAERRRRRTIERLHEHFIICGYGRVGRRVANEFRAAGVSYVVLDFSEEAVEAAREHGDLFIEGSGVEDEDLQRAGLERAQGLVAASDSDADNLYITLSARAAKPELTIVARASDEDAERKLKLAGADRVVLPYATAGQVMANLVLRPQVTAFLDTVTTATGSDLQLAEIEVRRTCPAAGRTIRDLRIRHETGAIVIALRKRDGTFDTTPEPDVQIDVGDVLIGVGSPDEIRRLEDLFAPREAVAG